MIKEGMTLDRTLNLSRYALLFYGCSIKTCWHLYLYHALAQEVSVCVFTNLL